ncbi:WYL domain-containing protein [Pseudolysinimonas kribbensis]|uniref:Transcriptional regulator n=1 Tax=Pseudolysinimonas kribbensis TaxID=433641 RepID=A0ABQ6K6N8_9MICO|nr:YafY family protein [Pseudolysinimonas kribbensis]GMA96313.1 transcriptional regulator [Pseudolysinimonas kribbensis]
MIRPTARVLAMLEALQAGGIHPVPGLAQLLGVDERTVRRYVDHLRELDVPVEAVRGRLGGYRLAPGYRMPPLMLTEDEAVATVLALASRSRDEPAQPAVATALAKLRRAMPRELARRIDALLGAVSFVPGDSADGDAADAGDVPARTLVMLAEAARERHPVALRYADRTGRRSSRTVLPYGVVARAGRWYLAAADSLSGEVRTFRLDRIGLPRVLPGTFEPPADVDAVRTVQESLAATPWAHEVVLRITAPEEAIRGRFAEGVAVLERVDDESFRVRLRAEALEWIPGVLATLGRPVIVERPDRLRELVKDLGRLLADAGED